MRESKNNNDNNNNNNNNNESVIDDAAIKKDELNTNTNANTSTDTKELDERYGTYEMEKQRFDFNGNIISKLESEHIDTTRGLHHHGDDHEGNFFFFFTFTHPLLYMHANTHHFI